MRNNVDSLVTQTTYAGIISTFYANCSNACVLDSIKSPTYSTPFRRFAFFGILNHLRAADNKSDFIGDDNNIVRWNQRQDSLDYLL
jgi:hypothetical protein